MIFQIEISSRMNSFKLLESEWKLKFDVTGSVCIMSKLQVIMKTMLAFWESKSKMPLHPGLFPFVVPVHFSSGLHEKLHFHLFEFAHPENKLSCNNFIAECF